MTDLERKVCSLRSILRDLIPTHEPQTWMDRQKDGLIPSYMLVRMMARTIKEAVKRGGEANG